MKILKKKTNRNPHTANHESPDIHLSKVSERRYQDLFNNASDAIFIRDLKGNTIEVNEAAVTLTGYTRNELTGMNVSEVLTAESFKTTMKKQKALLEDETAPQRYELEIIRKDGVRLSAESRTSLLTHDRWPIGVQCIVRDITERKRAEEALRFHSSIVEQAKDSVIVTNHNYEIEYVNKATEELYGYSREELVGLTPLILNAEPMAEDIQRDIYQTVSSGEVMTGAVLNKRKDGSTFVCDFKVSPLSNKNGRVLGYIGIQRDITEQRRMEEALQESEERYRTVADFTYDWEYWIGPDGDLRYISPSCERMTGYRVDEFLRDRKLLNRIIHPDDYPVIAQHIDGELKSKEALHVDFRITSRSGEERWISHWCHPVYGNDGSWLGRRGSNRDITERKRVEEALQASEERFRNIYEESPIGIELYDCDGRLLTVNRACLGIFGVSNIAEVQGFRLFEDPNITDEIKQILHKGKTVRYEAPFDFEKVKEHKLYDTSKSRAIYLNVLITPLGVRGEKPLDGYLVQVQDITERKRAEEELRIAEQSFRNSLDSSPLGIRIVTAEGELLYANQAILGIYGYSSIEELKRVPTKQRYTPESYTEHQMRKAKRKHGEPVPADYEISILRKDGEVRHLAVFRKAVIWGSEIRFQTLYQDITQRKQVEEALQASEEGFRNIYEESPIGIELYDCDGRLLTVNRACLDIFGVSNVTEVQGFKLFEDPNITDEAKQRLHKGEVVRHEAPFDFEKVKEHKLYNTSKSGTIHLSVSITPLGVRGEKPLDGYLVQVQDITERKRAEEELRIAEQSFRNSLDSSPLGIRIVTAEGELLYANQAILGIYGYSSVEELKSVPAERRYTPKSYAKHQMRKAKRKHGEPVPADYEISILRKDGEVRHLAVFRKAVIWGSEIRFQTLYQDITEHKRVEMALRQSEEFNSSLLTNSPSPILVLNADASIMYVNPALEKLTGFSSAELLGSKPPYPWWMEEKRKELSRRLVQAMHRGTRKYESLYRKKNGEQFWVEKIFKTVKVDGEFKYYLVNWVDLTEQKRLKTNLEFYLSQVTRAQEEERKRIAREIHDESIQSLATLALGIDSIAKEKERLPEDVIRRLKGLRAETNSVLDELRRFSHELRPGVIDQVGLVPALEILIEELNKENRVKVSLEVAGSEQRLIPETELALFRIAQEALHNVRRHSRATKATIRLKFTREKIQLTVSDNGRGFEPPHTLSDLATESKLGLIGIQERTRLLNGRLFVRSRVGRGTTVVVEVADIQGMKG